MARKDFGPTVLDGALRRTSASALENADPTGKWGCLRKWWYDKVLGKKQPETDAMALGTAIHAEIEGYLRTGEAALGAYAMSAWEFIPDAPNPLHEIEHNIEMGAFDIGGVPFVGMIDLINRSEFYINPMGTSQYCDLLEVLDWKSKKDLKYAFSGVELIKTIQMTEYARYAMQRHQLDQVRLSHVYMQTKGRKKSSKSTFIADAEKMLPRWTQTEALVRTLADVAGESDVNKIPPNLGRRCDYCTHATYCPRTAAQAATFIFGKDETTMSLLPTPAVALKIAQLKAAEAPATAPPHFADAIIFMQAEGFGRPALAGQAAVFYANMQGWAPAEAYEGEGRAGPCTIDDPVKVIEIAKECAVSAGKVFPPVAAAPPVPVLPPDAPASDPELASDPVDGFEIPVEVAPGVNVIQAPTAEMLESALRVAEIVTTGRVSSADALPAAPPTEHADSAEQPNFKKMKSPERLAECERLWALLQAKAIVERAVASEATTLPDRPHGEASIFVDCILNTDYIHDDRCMNYWVREACEAICKQFGAKDIRCGPKDGPLGFGGWKGVLAAYVREAPLPVQSYYLDTRGSEINEVVAEALAHLVVARGIR